MSLMFHTGVVESRDDPLKIGRCKVRIVGIHTEDLTLLPTADLPWAYPMQPVNSAAMSGIGLTPVGPVPGTWVIVAFQDEAKQFPIMLGTIGGVPQESLYGQIDIDDGNLTLKPSGAGNEIELRTVPRTIAGQSSITFYDPQGQQTDFTSKLVVNMRVSGPGVADETLIEQIESKDTIRLSKPYGGNGENFITFTPPPSNLDAVKESLAGNEDTLNTGGTSNAAPSKNITVNSQQQPVRTDAAATQAAPTAAAPAETPQRSATNDSIPTIPPKGSGAGPKASDGIKALIAACDKVGLTNKVQKCALLGIAGGESKWTPAFENTSYDEDRFRTIFPGITNKRPDEEWKPYIRWNSAQKGREGFFRYVYGTTTRGKKFFDHTSDEDGAKYYGRGFIQLTGKSNYIRYNNLAKKFGLNIDIVNNPDSLNNDINVGAIVAALYIVDRVPKDAPLNNPLAYFTAAKNAVGKNSKDIAVVKENFFKYFFGEGSSYSPAVKDASPQPLPKDEPSASTPPASQEPVVPSPSATETRFGFRDPNGKYPLANLLNEPDTNRLARGEIKGTIIELKDAQRKTNVATSVGGSWSQPKAPFGGQYPFNKVFETESGHVQEFDDTPGNERLGLYHRAGTYFDIDADGTKIEYIAGDGYTIFSRNGFVYIDGSCNLTVGGNVNILCQSEANIKVEGNAELTFGGNVDMGVAKNLNIAVAEDFALKVGGNFDIDVGADLAAKVKGKVGLAAEGEIQTSTKGKYGLNVTGDIDVKSDSSSRIFSGDAMELKTGGNMRLDYSRGDFGNGANAAAPGTPKLPADATALPFPPAGNPKGNEIEALEPRDRTSTGEQAVETPDDADTPEGRKQTYEKEKDATGTANPTGNAENAPKPSGGGPDPKSKVDCAVIFTTDRFTDSYRLSKNFTLGDVIAQGGVNGNHRLQNQELSPARGAPTRTYTVQEIVCNLANTVQGVLEPSVEYMPNGMAGYKKSWMITSGYRLRGVIKNEVPNSTHCRGQALDLGLIGGATKYRKTFEIIQQIEKVIPYDQLIMEYADTSACWIHLGWNYQGNNRKQAFTLSNHGKNYPGFVFLEPQGGLFPRK